ncbi:MAG: alpha/beta hydrolase [Rhodanobacter sp.]
MATPLMAASSTTVDQSRPLWGSLEPGTYEVGFRRVFAFDKSRTWQSTRDYTGRFSPDLLGRPIQVNVWYPASPGSKRTAMIFGDYVEQRSPPAFSALNDIMLVRNREVVSDSFDNASATKLLSTSMGAFKDVASLNGPFPLVIIVGGLNAEINANVVLAEYLASHGYVVASISLTGSVADQPSQSRSPDDIETAVRDIEFVTSVVCDGKNVDCRKLAVIGHSVGAVDALVFARRNGNVLAAIGLDGTYAFKGNQTVLSGAYGYHSSAVLPAILDLRRAQGEQSADLDLEPILALSHADRTLVSLRKMHHSDFTSFAMSSEKFEVPTKATYNGTGWNRATARSGYESVSRIVLAFLDDKVKREKQAAASFLTSVNQAKPASFRHIDATPRAPNPAEFVDLLSTRPIDDIHAIFRDGCSGGQLSDCVDQDRFNNFGYDLLHQKRVSEAVAVFDLVAWAHPGSANAQDSLADGYMAQGNRGKAKDSVERALALAPHDESLDDAEKAQTIATETKRLQELQ